MSERNRLVNCPISCFADEIAKPLDRQIEVLTELGIKWIEFRSADGIGVAEHSIEQAKEVKRKLDAAGIKVSAMGSPIGKIKIDEDMDAHIEKLVHMERLADIFETKNIRMFSFYLPQDESAEGFRDEVMHRMERMVKEASHNDIVLLHENEKGIYGDNAACCLDLMQQFYGANFKATFDFANFIQCGQDTMEAYDMLKTYIEYVHVKDALLSNGEVVPPGEGDGQLLAIFNLLNTAKYQGFLSLEPHLANFSGLQNLEQDAAVRVENDTEKAFCIAFDGLQKLLTKQ